MTKADLHDHGVQKLVKCCIFKLKIFVTQFLKQITGKINFKMTSKKQQIKTI